MLGLHYVGTVLGRTLLSVGTPKLGHSMHVSNFTRRIAAEFEELCPPSPGALKLWGKEITRYKFSLLFCFSY